MPPLTNGSFASRPPSPVEAELSIPFPVTEASMTQNIVGSRTQFGGSKESCPNTTFIVDQDPAQTILAIAEGVVSDMERQRQMFFDSLMAQPTAGWSWLHSLVDHASQTNLAYRRDLQDNLLGARNWARGTNVLRDLRRAQVDIKHSMSDIRRQLYQAQRSRKNRRDHLSATRNTHLRVQLKDLRLCVRVCADLIRQATGTLSTMKSHYDVLVLPQARFDNIMSLLTRSSWGASVTVELERSVASLTEIACECASKVQRLLATYPQDSGPGTKLDASIADHDGVRILDELRGASAAQSQVLKEIQAELEDARTIPDFVHTVDRSTSLLSLVDLHSDCDKLRELHDRILIGQADMRSTLQQVFQELSVV